MIPHSLLLSGMDIPFPEARVNIVQPKVKDILYISEDSFYSGCELLNFSKDVLYQQDKVGLEDKTNFHRYPSLFEQTHPKEECA